MSTPAQINPPDPSTYSEGGEATNPGAVPVASTPVAPPAQSGAASEAVDRADTARGQEAQTVQPQAGPTVVHPVRRSGLAGIVDEIRDAIAGKSTGKVYQDPETGDKYIKNEDISTGGKWLRIASTALRGAGKGMQVGQGPGGAGRAFGAGVDEGFKVKEEQKKEAKEQSQEVKQAQLDKFNMIKLKHDVTAGEFGLARMKVAASESDVKFAQSQLDREKSLGSADLGIYKDAADLANVQKQDPKFWKNVYGNNVVAVPELDPATGERKGIHVFLRTPGIGSQLAPEGSQVQRYVPGEKPTDPPKLVAEPLSHPATIDQLDSWNNAAAAKMQQWHASQEKDKDEAAKRALQTEQTKTEKTKQSKNIAETGKANAETNKINKAAQAGDEGLIDMIGTGHMDVGRLSYVLARNPDLAKAVATKYPDFDNSKVSGYAATVKDFLHGPAAKAMNSGGTVLQHLKRLDELNTPASHIPYTSDWIAYQNQLHTLAPELGRFYGEATIPALKHYEDTLGSTLPGNRHAAIETQVKSMGKKLDSFEQQWKNAAPSKAYHPQMPDISEAGKEARAALDPEYRERRVQELNQNPQQVRSGVRPGEPTALAADGKTTLVVRDGKWVAVQ